MGSFRSTIGEDASDAVYDPGEPIRVTRFRSMGINASLGLDPDDPLALPTGLSFVNRTPTSIAMTPVVVPEPSTLLVAVTALVGLAHYGRRRAA